MDLQSLSEEEKNLLRCAGAYNFEQALWVTRINRESKLPWEVCRLDENSLNVEYTEIHGFENNLDAQDAQTVMGDVAAARAFLRTMDQRR